MAQLTTFVFTDLVGSVALKQRMPGVDAATRDAQYVEQVLQPHRARIEAGLAAAEGRVVSTAGDGHFVVFPDTAQAALWAIEVVRSHRATPIAAGEAVAEVRIGMHSGVPQPDPADPDNFIGRAVDYAARLADHAQGGQILVSRTTAALIEDGVIEGVTLHSHGPHELRGIGSAELYEVLYPGRTPGPPRRNTTKAPAREWSVLPRTMGLTEYAAQSGSGVPQRGSSNSALTAVRPRQVGNYELEELLGAGGMGNVYKARHAQFDRPRAVKIIRPDLVEAGGESVVRRFYQEVRATGALEHPNLVVAIDSSTPDDEEHYLVMEYIDGLSVDRLLEVEGPLPVADACEIARQAAMGLAHLDEEGLVHRDVKPSNLMVTLASSPHLQAEAGESGAGRSTSTAKLPVVKLMDLGLALLVRGDEERVTRFDRGGMGTGYYMPPEQWRTTSVDIRADIYSLGCTLYCLLMGEPPYARSDLRPERAHATAPIPPLKPACGAPRELVDLVNRMLAKRPEDRPQSPLEVAEALTPLAVGNRLAERLARVRTAGAVSIRRQLRDETQPDQALAAGVDTHGPANSLTSPSTYLGVVRSPWLITGVTTVIACLALLALVGVRTAKLERHRASLLRTAGFAADKMGAAIDARIDTITQAAENPNLSGWLAELREARDTDQPPEQAREQLQNWLVKQRDRASESYPSSSWFVTDERGVQIARSPPSRTIGQTFASRDYFHGRGPEYAADPANPQPVEDPHQSAVYRSKTRPEDLKVAFSTPIYDGQRVVGVLAMSVVLGDFRELDKTDSIADDVEILLADTGVDLIQGEARRGLVLHHRKLRAGSRLGGALLEEVSAQNDSNRAAMLSPYKDILGRDDPLYWGAIAPVVPENLPAAQDGEWVVIAQEPQP